MDAATNSRQACGACGLVDKILINHDWFNEQLAWASCVQCARTLTWQNHFTALKNLSQGRCCNCLISRPCRALMLTAALTVGIYSSRNWHTTAPNTSHWDSNVLCGADKAFTPRLFHCWIRIHFPNTPNSQPRWLATITCML